MHFWKSFEWSMWTSCFLSQRSWGDFSLPLVTSTSLETPFQFDVYFYFRPLVKIHVLWLPPMKCCVFFSWLGCFFFVTWVNILSNMLILIVVMETTRTNHKNFQVVLHCHSYMPQQNDKIDDYHAAVTYSCFLWSCNDMGTHHYHFHSEYY